MTFLSIHVTVRLRSVRGQLVGQILYQSKLGGTYLVDVSFLHVKVLNVWI